MSRIVLLIVLGWDPTANTISNDIHTSVYLQPIDVLSETTLTHMSDAVVLEMLGALLDLPSDVAIVDISFGPVPLGDGLMDESQDEDFSELDTAQKGQIEQDMFWFDVSAIDSVIDNRSSYDDEEGTDSVVYKGSVRLDAYGLTFSY